jgi:hypothetical protein
MTLESVTIVPYNSETITKMENEPLIEKLLKFFSSMKRLIALRYTIVLKPFSQENAPI